MVMASLNWIVRIVRIVLIRYRNRAETRNKLPRRPGGRPRPAHCIAYVLSVCRLCIVFVWSLNRPMSRVLYCVLCTCTP